MTRTPVWDPAVRLFHWSLVTGFAANALIVDAESKLHQWIGYTVVGLVAFRILWGFVGSRYARFSSFRPSLSDAIGQLTDIATHRNRRHIGHSPLGALMIYNLIATLLAIGLTGYLMTTDRFWGVDWPEELHEAFVTWAEISVVLHIAAVIFESRRTKVNLARAMVTGYKELPES
ncbi:MAG: cytochrome b/b6 domain-containing protein [Pseudodonghicola sp.]